MNAYQIDSYQEVVSRSAATPKLKDVKQVSDGWIKKYELTYELPDGSPYEYEAVSRKSLEDYKKALQDNASGVPAAPDAICIVPILPDDSILLIREFRYPVNAWCIEFPAGLKEPNETIAECVNRELKEETGFQVRTDLEGSAIMPFEQTSYSTVGMGEENVQVVIAYVEPAGVAQPTPGELIETFCVARDDVSSFLEANHDLLGVRCQLLLEAVKRNQVLRKRLALAQNPITSKDFA